jgi:hypothetical protein
MSIQRQMRDFGTCTPVAGPERIWDDGAAALYHPAHDEFTYRLSRLVGIAAMGAGILGTTMLLISV